MSLEVHIQKKLNGFELDVQFATAGRITGILGASGSGKSMTLRCIAGIETPDRGRIVLNDRVLFDTDQTINLPPQKRNVGYLFQNYALFPHLTVEKNIACACPPGTALRNKNPEHWISLFRLKGLEKRYPSQLSGGQQQRVALARMLAGTPEILLFDEPFSALDFSLKEEIQFELLQLMREYDGDAVMVTHSRDEAYQLCETLAIVENGQIRQIGSKKEVFDHPSLTITAQLTGCKNIQRARKISDTQVYVEAWDCHLHVARPIPQHLSHIGVRAHHWQAPADSELPHAVNAIPVILEQRVENPFDWNVLFRCGRNHTGRIWWKHSKTTEQLPSPTHLAISPESILLLVDGENPDVDRMLQTR